jgi:hypothetical protein
MIATGGTGALLRSGAAAGATMPIARQWVKPFIR